MLLSSLEEYRPGKVRKGKKWRVESGVEESYSSSMKGIIFLMGQNEIKVQVNNLTLGERAPLLLLLASIVGFPLPHD